MPNWNVDTLSAAIALVAMLVSAVFSAIAVSASRKQLRLQRWQARQDLRNHTRAWAEEVVEVLQDGITHCFIFQKGLEDKATSLHFTQLAGKISELIDCGRWHFENDKRSGYGRWKEGAFPRIGTEGDQYLEKSAWSFGARSKKSAQEIVLLRSPSEKFDSGEAGVRQRGSRLYTTVEYND